MKPKIAEAIEIKLKKAVDTVSEERRIRGLG